MANEKGIGRPKAFKDPVDLWEEFLKYKQHILDEPIEVVKWVGKDAHEVIENHYKPPTWKGFEAFLFRAGRIYDLDAYRRNVGGDYSAYSGIIRAIGADMFDRKLSGAAVGIYNHNIIARELGLADASQVTNFQRPILEGGKELPADDAFDDDDIMK
jgi:hypothetical protein